MGFSRFAKSRDEEYIEFLREKIAENNGIDILHDNSYRLNDDADALSECLLMQYNFEESKRRPFCMEEK